MQKCVFFGGVMSTHLALKIIVKWRAILQNVLILNTEAWGSGLCKFMCPCTPRAWARKPRLGTLWPTGTRLPGPSVKEPRAPGYETRGLHLQLHNNFSSTKIKTRRILAQCFKFIVIPNAGGHCTLAQWLHKMYTKICLHCVCVLSQRCCVCAQPCRAS